MKKLDVTQFPDIYPAKGNNRIITYLIEIM
jgi:hypothetical protein